MNQGSKYTCPLPKCWLESWHKHAADKGLSSFPTREYLADHKSHAGSFCQWVWRELIRNEGYMCDQRDNKECCSCQRESVSKVISIGILSLIVRDEDPTLYFVLRRKFRQMTRHELPERIPASPCAPDNPPEPHSPLAVNMPIPRRWIHTNAVARELWDGRYGLAES